MHDGAETDEKEYRHDVAAFIPALGAVAGVVEGCDDDGLADAVQDGEQQAKGNSRAHGLKN